MKPRTLHTRLTALAAGVMVAVCAVVAVCLMLPAQSQVDAGREYGYVYSGVKSSSVDFTRAAMDDDSLLVLGSSEFSTPQRLVPQVPAQVFGQNDYGLQLMLVGEAFDQSLWHAIALGAYDGAGIPGNKVALIVAPGWFVDGGQDAEAFQTRFSYSLYQRFCANDRVPQQARDYVRARLAAMGIDENTLHAASPTLPQDALNGMAFGAMDDLKLRQGLAQVRAKGTERAVAEAPHVPDFAALRAEAAQTGADMSTTNDWGVEDSFYTEQLQPAISGMEGSRASETYTDTPEYDDLECFLDIADACGIQVLVVVSPVLGPYYDYIGIGAQTRQNCYGRVRGIVEQHSGVQLADFSDREYERYFLYDIVHFGWTGWVDVEESLYRFAKGGA